MSKIIYAKNFFISLNFFTFSLNFFYFLSQYFNWYCNYCEETEITKNEINFLKKSKSLWTIKIIHLGDTIVEILSFFENKLNNSNEEKEGEENIELTYYIQNNEEIDDDEISGIVKAYMYL